MRTLDVLRRTLGTMAVGSSGVAARICLMAAIAGSTGCATTSVVGRTVEGNEIVQVPLRLSNAYLIRSKTPILIDSGTLGDMEDLTAGLAENGVRTSDLAVVIVTHAHADHAGLAANVRSASDAKIFLGLGDLELAQAGHNDDLRPQSLTARLLKPFIPSSFPAFRPDQVIREPISLAPWGIDGTVIPMPGHTGGSLVVVLANKTAFVGDVMAGGSFGGLLWPHTPGGHYFHADAQQNRRNIERLLAMGIETFYLGHGGPVTREDVLKATF